MIKNKIKKFLLYILKKIILIYKTNFLFAFGLTMCIIWVIVAIFAPMITPFDPNAQNLLSRFESPNENYLFGTDMFGRDIFSRVIAGSRLSITAGIITVLVALFVGSIYGAIAGYIGGTIDDIMMRFSELIRSFPAIVLAMLIAAALGPSLYNTLFAMVIVWWPNYARVMRSMVISEKENEYIQAAKVMGASNLRIIFDELLPNCIGPVLVLATLDIGNAILTFSGLSFLGLGAPPPTAEWGSMVSQGVDNFAYWWIATFPGLAILSVAMGANFIGDGLRDYLDPKLRKEF